MTPDSRGSKRTLRSSARRSGVLSRFGGHVLEMAANARLRSALYWLHRWLGLSLGLIFAVVALSGSLLLFQPQYFKWAHGHMIPGGLVQEPGSIDAWVENGRATVPGLGEPIAIWRPHVSHNVSEAGMLIFAGLDPGGLGNMGFVGMLVAPATGSVLGTFDVDRSPAYAPLFLHRDLWTGEAGRIVNGVMAIGSLLFLLIGLYLWWPRPGRILRKLSPRPWRTTLTNVALLHEWTGVWTLLALLVSVASGLYLAQPTWVEPTLALLPDRHEEKSHDQSACQEAIGFDAALARASALVPTGSRWTALYPHDEDPQKWEITFKTGRDTDAEHGDTHVIADLRCGTVTVHETSETRSSREAAEVWLEGLHSGTIFGRPGEIIVALLGLIPLVMYVTGLINWWRKRKTRMSTRSTVYSPAR